MKIERVDDKTIKCYLSKDELAYYQVDYSDFTSLPHPWTSREHIPARPLITTIPK